MGDPRFTRVPLLADPLDVALPKGHALATAEPLRLADLAAEDWIFGGSGPWSDITRGACEAAGFSPRQAHSAAGWTAILAMVEAGRGVALVPRTAAVPRGGVVMRELGGGAAGSACGGGCAQGWGGLAGGRKGAQRTANGCHRARGDAGPR